MSSAMQLTKEAEDYLDALAEELAVSESRYEQAERRYLSLGKWLNRSESTVRKYDPHVYVQGSFRLGTTIRPVNEEEDYDIDSICELRALTRSSLSQSALKQLLGTEIHSYHRAQSMTKPVREGRRCWVLDYADGAQFHMDVVPALPNETHYRLLLQKNGLDIKLAKTALVITDNETVNYHTVSDDWPRSNPKGYAEWFKARMAVVFEARRRKFAESIRAGVEEVPDYKIRTPLQSAIMILKRHRDMRFENDKDNRPISIIITTLSAHAYQSEETTAGALASILARMENFIRVVNGRYVIANPADPFENFADKWAEHPERAKAFFDWLQAARRDFGQAAALSNNRRIADSIGKPLGAKAAEGALARVLQRAGSGLSRAASVAPISGASGLSFPDKPRVPTTPKGFA